MKHILRISAQSDRVVSLLLMLCSLGLLLSAFILEWWLTLEPCPMCELQRILLATLVLILGLRLIFWNFVGLRNRLRTLLLLLLIIGSALAARQTYLQYHPELVGDTCLPGLAMIYSLGGWWEVAKIFWYGSSQCAKISFQVYGITIPGMLSVCYIFMLGLYVRFTQKFNR